MVTHCHRCGSVLDEDAAFCPHCAAPQLRVAPPEETTEQPGGPVHTFTRDRRSVDWRNVIRLAIWTAIPVGLIAPFFFPMVIAGPIVLISLYQRRRPSSPLDGKAGFRIGGLMGVLAAYVSAFGLAIWQLLNAIRCTRARRLTRSTRCRCSSRRRRRRGWPRRIA